MTHFKDTLQNTKQTKSSTKKEIPVIENIPKEIIKASKEFITKMKLKKQLEYEIATLSNKITEFAQNVQDERAFNGDFNKSYKMIINDDEIMFTTKNVFKINYEDEDKIKEIFGKNFSNFIEEKMEVVLKEEVFENEELQNELMSLLGDKFSKFFNTYASLKVCENYDEKIYAFAKTPEKLSDIRKLIQPSKPILK